MKLRLSSKSGTKAKRLPYECPRCGTLVNRVVGGMFFVEGRPAIICPCRRRMLLLGSHEQPEAMEWRTR